MIRADKRAAGGDEGEDGSKHWTISDLLEVEELDRGKESSLYRSLRLWRPWGARGVFGGQVIGQSLVVACKTVPERFVLHSMHAYFLLAGNAEQPIVYNVRQVRDGRSFATRLVLAMQSGKAIFHLMASFQVPEPSTLEHEYAMPEGVPPPEELRTEAAIQEELIAHPDLPERARVYLQQRHDLNPVPMEVRPCEPVDFLRPRKLAPRYVTWMRTAQPLESDDPNLHRSIAAYASDYSLLPTAVRPSGWPSGRLAMMASLDHTVHFHEDFRADEWLLYVQESSKAAGGRAYTHGRLYTREGRLVMSVVQEGVVRLQTRL